MDHMPNTAWHRKVSSMLALSSLSFVYNTCAYMIDVSDFICGSYIPSYVPVKYCTYMGYMCNLVDLFVKAYIQIT